MFGFVSGGVQVGKGADAVREAGLLLAMAIALRQKGLNSPGAGWRSGSCWKRPGLLVKSTMIAFAPAAAVVVIAALRTREDRRNALGGMAAAAAGLAVPLVVFVVLSTAVWHRPIAGSATAVAHTKQGLSPNLREQLVYAWQLYLPRLPFMKDEFAGGWPPWDLWYRGLLGRFGWLDYQFPQWVAWTVLPLFAVVVAAALSGLVRLRSLVRGRWLELVVYVLFALGCSARSRSPAIAAVSSTTARSSRRGTCCRFCRCTPGWWRSPHARWGGAGGRHSVAWWSWPRSR